MRSSGYDAMIAIRDGVLKMDGFVLINGVPYQVVALERVTPGWLNAGFRRYVGPELRAEDYTWFGIEALT